MVFQGCIIQLDGCFCPGICGLRKLCNSLEDHAFELDRLQSRKIQIARDDGELNRFGFSGRAFSVKGDQLQDRLVVWFELEVDQVQVELKPQLLLVDGGGQTGDGPFYPTPIVDLNVILDFLEG